MPPMHDKKSHAAAAAEMLAAAVAAGNLTEPETAQKETKLLQKVGSSSGSFSNNQGSETTAEERMNQTAQSFRSTSSQFN